jgi:hypothetical protein
MDHGFTMTSELCSDHCKLFFFFNIIIVDFNTFRRLSPKIIYKMSEKMTYLLPKNIKKIYLEDFLHHIVIMKGQDVIITELKITTFSAFAQECFTEFQDNAKLAKKL